MAIIKSELIACKGNRVWAARRLESLGSKSELLLSVSFHWSNTQLFFLDYQ